MSVYQLLKKRCSPLSLIVHYSATLTRYVFTRQKVLSLGSLFIKKLLNKKDGLPRLRYCRHLGQSMALLYRKSHSLMTSATKSCRHPSCHADIAMDITVTSLQMLWLKLLPPDSTLSASKGGENRCVKCYPPAFRRIV
jgi:hypothetical protein